MLSGTGHALTRQESNRSASFVGTGSKTAYEYPLFRPSSGHWYIPPMSAVPPFLSATLSPAVACNGNAASAESQIPVCVFLVFRFASFAVFVACMSAAPSLAELTSPVESVKKSMAPSVTSNAGTPVDGNAAKVILPLACRTAPASLTPSSVDNDSHTTGLIRFAYSMTYVDPPDDTKSSTCFWMRVIVMRSAPQSITITAISVIAKPQACVVPVTRFRQHSDRTPVNCMAGCGLPVSRCVRLMVMPAPSPLNPT